MGDRLALVGGALGLFAHHGAGRGLRLAGEPALQVLERFAARHTFGRIGRRLPAMRAFGARRGLFDHEGHAQVRRQLGHQAVEHLGVDLRADNADRGLREHMREIGPWLAVRRLGRMVARARARVGGVVRVDPILDLGGGVWRRHELHAQLLRQRLDHRHDELIAQSGHIPAELRGADARERGHRDVHTHAVLRVGRVVDVTQAQRQRGPVRSDGGPMVGEVVQAHRLDAVETVHLLGVEIEQRGVAGVLGLPPARQFGHIRHVLRHDPLVEVVEVLVAHRLGDLAGAARVVLRVLDDRAVARDEVVVREALLDAAFHKALPQQEITGLERIDASPLHMLAAHDRQSIQQHGGLGDRAAARGGPVRVRVRGAREVLGERLGPRRVDLRAIPRPQAARLHEFGRHDPRWGGRRGRGSGENREMRAACALIVVLRHLLGAFERAGAGGPLEIRVIRGLRFAHHLHAEHRQQAGEHRRVDALRVPRTAQRVCGLLVDRQRADLFARPADGNRLAHGELELAAQRPQL